VAFRYAEFGRSLALKKLQRATAKYTLHYLAVLRDSQKDVVEAIEEMVYQSWDGSASAPPKTRPREATQEPRLGTILWQDGRPVFPTTLLTKFAEDSDHRAELLKLKEKVEELWPSDGGGAGTGTGSTVRRAAGAPDFSGVEVLDISREVSLSVMTSYDDFSEERLLFPGQ